MRFSYDFSHANGNFVYTIPAGSPIATPNPLPDVFNKLQQLHIDVRHRLTHNLAATFSYLYEPFRVYDFAFDPSVVNGIVQPSSLVMGTSIVPIPRTPSISACDISGKEDFAKALKSGAVALAAWSSCTDVHPGSARGPTKRLGTVGCRVRSDDTS